MKHVKRSFALLMVLALAELRRSMGDPEETYIDFAVAYHGYVGGLFDEGFEAGFPKWLAQNNPRQLEENPSIAEIDENHIVGGANYDTVDGSMYLSETYPVMISPSGELLIIAAGENGIPLSFMMDSTLMIELMLACG